MSRNYSKDKKKSNPRDYLRSFQTQKEDIIKQAVQQMKKEMGQVQQTEREEKMRRQDASILRLQEMEERLEKLCLQTEWEDEMEKDDDMIETYVYTDAWNPAPLCEYAWEMMDANMSTISATYADPNAFAAWVHAIMEDFLASQEQIIGIHGHTRTSVEDARARLQNLEIPEHIGLLLLMLRPMRIENTFSQLILLPHRLQRVVDPDANAIIGNQLDLTAQRGINGSFSPARVVIKPVGGLPVGFDAPACVRINVLVHVTEAYLFCPQNGTISGIANLMFATNHLTRQYPPMYRMHLIANTNTVNIVSSQVWYDFIYNVSFDHIFDRAFTRSYVMIGNQKEHIGRVVREVPMRVIDQDNNMMLWNSGVGVKEMLVPWFEFGSMVAARAFVQGLREIHAAMNYVVINQVSDRKLKHKTLRQWYLELKNLVFGDVTKLFASLGR